MMAHSTRPETASNRKLAKRSSCDRCRSKRLRCPRPAFNTEPCARCVRAGEKCATGSPREVGRPRKVALETTGNRNSVGLPLKVCPVDVSDREKTLEDGRHVGNIDKVQQDDYAQPQADVHLAWNDLDFDWTSFDAIEQNETTLEDDLLTLNVFSSIQPQNVDSLGNGLGDAPSVNNIVPGHQPSGLESSIHFDTPSLPKPKSRPQTAEITVALLRFSENLTHWLSIMEQSVWQGAFLVQHCIQTVDKPAENPVAQAFSSTKELCAIVQNLKISCQDSGPGSVPTGARTGPVSTPVALLVLSSHLQLMQLYDNLFSHLCSSLRVMPLESVRSVRVHAVICSAGNSTTQEVTGAPYARVIVDMMQTEIQTLEEHIGLPDRYCLLGINKSTTGLFTNTNIEAVIHTIMMQDDVRSLGTAGNSCAESVRQNIGHVLQMLDV